MKNTYELKKVCQNWPRNKANMTDFNKRVEFQLSCQWTDVTTLLIVWFVISIVLKDKKVKKNNRVDTIIQEIRVQLSQSTLVLVDTALNCELPYTIY